MPGACPRAGSCNMTRLNSLDSKWRSTVCQGTDGAQAASRAAVCLRGAVSFWAWMCFTTIKTQETCGGNSLLVEIPWPVTFFSGTEIKTMILLDGRNVRLYKPSALSCYPCLNLVKVKHDEKQGIDGKFLIDAWISLPLESTYMISQADSDVIPQP